MVNVKGKYNYSECIIAYMLFFSSITYYVQFILANNFGNESKLIPILLYGLGIVASFLSYKRMRNSILGIPLLIIMLLGTMLFNVLYPFYYGMIYTSFSEIAYNPVLLLFIYSLPLAFWNVDKLDLSLLLHICILLSEVVLILLVLAYMVYLNNPIATKIDYMPFSYNALPAICFCISDKGRSKRHIFDFSLAAVGTLIVFISGSRGCFVCIALFLITYLIFVTKFYKGAFTIGTVLFIAFFVINIPDMLSDSMLSLEKNGIHSRTISRLLDGSADKSEGRDIIADKLYQGIQESPIFGYGLWGDRAVLNGVGFSHNIALELVTSFGIIVGSVLLLILIYSILKMLLSHIDKTRKLILCCTLSFGFYQLFFSGSFLNDPWFFFLLAQLVGSKPYDSSALCHLHLKSK